MKTKSILLIFFVILICRSSLGLVSSKDTCFSGYFNKSEVEQLTKIVDYFDQIIQTNYPDNSGSLAESYKLFFKHLNSFRIASKIYEHVFIKFDQKIISESIDENLFNKIWSHQKKRTNNIYRISDIALKPDSPYMSFLKQHPFLKEYCETIEIAGDISPASLTVFNSIQTKLNTNDLSDRLIIAVHYISLSSPIVKKKISN